MSLMHFLVATKSLKTVKDAPSPYRMDQTNLLPKFSQKKEETESIDTEGKAAERRTEPPIAASPTPANQAIKARKKWDWHRLRKIFRSSTPAHSKPVQTELSLDTVRVVRSSLCEREGADEPVGHSAKPEPQLLPRTPSLAGQWWNRLQTRLFAQRRRQS